LFSTTFRYALICLLELAESKETLQASRIAGKFHLSPHYLSVVLRELQADLELQSGESIQAQFPRDQVDLREARPGDWLHVQSSQARSFEPDYVI